MVNLNQPQECTDFAKQLSLLIKHELSLGKSYPGIDLPEVTWVEHTSSTNTDLLNYLREGGSAVQVRGAWQQSAGRGRANRSWRAAPGQSLLMSLGLRLNLSLEQILPLPLVAGIAATEALLTFLPPNQHPRLKLKWPNDILWQGGKLAGILVEILNLDNFSKLRGVVLGIGINLSGASLLSQELDRPIADWSSIGVGRQPSGSEQVIGTAHQLACATICAWLKNIALLSQSGFQAFMPRFNALDALVDSSLSLVNDQQRVIFQGQAQGITDQGLLKVYNSELDIERSFAAGEVRIETIKNQADPLRLTHLTKKD